MEKHLYYQKLLTALKDTLYNTEAEKQLGAVVFDYEIRKNKVRSTCLIRKKPLPTWN